MQKPKGYWTKERCHEEALEFSTKAEFRRSSSSAYSAAKSKGWLDEVCAHMIPTRKPDGYWTKARVTQEALRYKTRAEFSKGAGSAYNKAHSEGWLEEACQHMKVLTKPAGYWTKERCSEAAQQYTTRTEFLKYDASAFRIAQRNGWLEDICSHMQRLVREAGYWTKPRLAKIAKKYSTRNDFHLNDNSAYRSAQARGLLDEICSHMEYQVLPRNYWTKKRIIKEAKKYKTRSEFMNATNGAWSRAQREGWLDEVCAHMKIADHGWLHCIYAITNKRLNKAYIGLTRQAFDVRMEQHKSSRNTTYSKLISGEDDTQFEQITAYKYAVNDIGDKEKEFIERYANAGWEVLNSQIQIGKVGSQTKWNYQLCSDEAANHLTRSAFRKQSPKAYNAAKRHGFLDELCAHMIEERKPAGYWTKERCLDEAQKCKTRAEFRKTGAYQATLKNDWAKEVLRHLPTSQKEINLWKKEECAAEAKKYTNRSLFSSGSRGAYAAAKKNGWLDEICQHMPLKRSSWSYSDCEKAAHKCKSRNEFKNTFSGAYSAALRNGWIDSICSHMTTIQNPSSFWTKEKCAEEALKYQRTSDFCKFSGNVYSKAKRNGWFDQITSHMINDTKDYVPRGFWNNKNNCSIEAKKYSSKNAFKKKSRGAYASAYKNGWLDEICQHMQTENKPTGYWDNKDRCFSEAKKYKTKTLFARGSSGAYAASKRYGWLDEISKLFFTN